MKKLLLILFAFLLVLGEIAAQNNVVRIGVPSLLYGRVNLNFEHVFGGNKSINLMAGFQVPRSFPQLIEELDRTGDFRVNGANWKAAGITPSIRFYVKKKKEAPAGFYMAPFVSYNYNNLDLDTEYDDGASRDVPSTIDTKLHGLGVGFMIGSQWIVNEHLSIDFNYFGIGFGRQFSNSTFKSSDTTVDYQQLADDFNEEAESENVFNNASVEAGPDFFKINTGSFSPIFKFSFAIGYAF